MDADRLPHTSDARPLLIPTPRQLNAALRKSAQRAQRLADAFGLTVPTARPPRGKTAKRPARKNTAGAAR
jgi:hypothetical protein